jgi:hypothetical protein
MIALIVLVITSTGGTNLSWAHSRQSQVSDVAIVTTENGQPFYDACFVLVDYSNEGCDSNRDGKITFEDIPLGTYTLRQTRDLGPDRHVPDSTITVTGAMGSDGWERFNAYVVISGQSSVGHGSGSVDIALITRDPQTGGLLTSTCYVLVDYSNQGCDENGDGQVTFAAIPYGVYTVRQTLTPPGYLPVNDYTIEVEPVRGIPGVGTLDIPLGFIVKQAPAQNAPDTRNVSVVLIDTATHEKVVADVCVEIVGASLVGCDEDLLDGQIDFLDVRAGGPYELRFTNLPPGTDVRTIEGPLAVTIDAGFNTLSNMMIYVLLDKQSAGASIVPADSAEATEVVRNDGFTIELDGVAISGAGDVAPVGTEIRARLVAQDLTDEVDEFAEPFGNGVDITLGDDLQPRSPLTITFSPNNVADWIAVSDFNDDLVPVVFITRTHGSGMELADARLLPDGSVEVTADHLSRVQRGFASITRFTAWTGEQIAVFFQVRSDEPDCVAQTLEDGLWEISPIPHQLVWPCVQQTGDDVKITLTNSSPQVWLVNTEQATPELPTVLSPVGMIFAAFVLQGIDQATTSPLIPHDGKVTFNASGVQDEIVFNATLNPPLTVINAALTALLIFANGRLIENLAKADCLIDIVSSAINLATTPDEEAFTDVDAGSLASTVAGCIGTTLGLLGAALGGALFSAVADAPGAVAANLQGAYLTITGDDSFPIILSKPGHTSDEPLGSVSSGGWPTDRDDSATGLYAWIGASSAWPGTGISGMPDWVACDNARTYCLLGYNEEEHVLVQISGFKIIGFIADWYPNPKEALLILGMTEEVADQILGI